MHEYLPTCPFDLFELHLLHSIAESGSFTKAAAAVGLTQSAVSRQIQRMENRIGFALLARTTRQIKITPAGDLLLRETRHILGDIESSLRRMREEFGNAPKQVRVGVSKTIGLAYLPGFFFANQRKFPEVGIKVRHESSNAVLSALEMGDLDIGIICPPDKIPDSLTVTHRFSDSFILIAPAGSPNLKDKCKPSETIWKSWLNLQHWLLIDEKSNTGRRLREWIIRQGGKIRASGETDNFDLIINLVALGLGISLVPNRALASYPRKRVIKLIAIPERFQRELVVLIRRTVRPVDHVTRFVENILF